MTEEANGWYQRYQLERAKRREAERNLEDLLEEYVHAVEVMEDTLWYVELVQGTPYDTSDTTPLAQAMQDNATEAAALAYPVLEEDWIN